MQPTVEHFLSYLEQRHFLYGDIEIEVVNTSPTCAVLFKGERYPCFECDVRVVCANRVPSFCGTLQIFYRFLETYKPFCIQDKTNTPFILVQSAEAVEEAISGVVLDD